MYGVIMDRSQIQKKVVNFIKNSAVGKIIQQESYDSYGYSAIDKISQLVLIQIYKEILKNNEDLPGIMNVGFKNFSQTDEDGILLYIFSLIGTTNKTTVEICAEDGIECNSANLIINHGWSGVLFDGDIQSIKKGRYFYAKCKDTWIYPPKFVHAWVDTENVNQLIQKSGVSGEIDLLSIDMDGVDYWIWKSINCINPRVVVVEFREMWGAKKAVTVPYKSDFNRFDIHSQFYGASLNAFVKLANQKGYFLAGVNRYGFNAFFLRNDIPKDNIPEIPIEKCFTHPRSMEIQQNVLPEVKDLQWIDV